MPERQPTVKIDELGQSVVQGDKITVSTASAAEMPPSRRRSVLEAGERVSIAFLFGGLLTITMLLGIHGYCGGIIPASTGAFFALVNGFLFAIFTTVQGPAHSEN